MREDHFTPEQQDWRTAVRAFVEHEVVPHQEKWLQAGIVDRDVWRKAGAAGLLCPWAAEEHGGLGLTDFRYEQVVIEELARVAESGLAVPLHSAIVAPYLATGTAEQRARWLPGAVSGETVLALAITEPDAGSDVSGITTRAVRDEAAGGWRVTGAKTYISNGILADRIVVAARTGTDRHAVGLFVVEGDAPGLERGRKLDKLGLRSQDTAELFLDGVPVPDEDVLGAPDGGFAVIMQMFAQERLTVACGNVAGAEAALDLTLRWVRERQAFGRPLSRFQELRHRLADLRTEIDVTQAYVDRCVLAHVAGRLSPQAAAQAKLHASEMLGRVVDDCVQMHGGLGYMWESPICRMYADARIQRIFAGTSEIMREVISRSMGL